MITTQDLFRHLTARTVLSINNVGVQFVINEVRTKPTRDDVQPAGAEPIAWATVWHVESGDVDDAYFLADDVLVAHGADRAVA